MHRTRLDLQYYISRAGDQIFAPPFTLDKEDMLICVLSASRDRLNALLDRELNGPWEQAFARRGLHHHYVAARDWVVVVLSEVDELYPAIFEGLRAARRDPDTDRIKGELTKLRALFGSTPESLITAMSEVTASQRELLVMVPLDDLGPDPQANLVVGRTTRLWYLPIVVNDLAPAVLAGRELFGYPKILGTFELAGGAQQTLLGDWRTLTIKAHAAVKRERPTPGNTYKLDLAPVLEISREPGTAVPQPADAAVLAEQARELFDQTIEFLFLRQFRDPQFQELASYQAAVTSSVTAAAGSFGRAMQLVDKPQQFCFRFPKIAEHYPRVVDALGILPNSDIDEVFASAVFTLQGEKLIVTRGEIDWDKS